MNNLLFIFALAVVFFGTTLPLFSELLEGRKIEPGPQFFNRTMAPIGIVLLFLTGIGPELAWKNLPKGLLKREFLLPAVLSAAAGTAAYLLGVKKWFPLAVSIGAVFGLTTIACEFVKNSRSAGGLFGFFRTSPGKFGGYLAHIGVVMLFIGLAGSSYKSEYKLELKKGEPARAGAYELVLDALEWTRGMEKEGVTAHVLLAGGGGKRAELSPALFLHRNQENPIAEVDLKIAPFRDVYIALAGAAMEDANIELTITPLILFVWLGGIFMVIGGVIALLPLCHSRGSGYPECSLDSSSRPE